MTPRVAVIAAAVELAPSDARPAPDIVFEVTQRAVHDSGLERGEIELTVSGSGDVLDGRAFGFVYGLDAMGAWPPTSESHVEMDGAWAAYLAWIKLLAGEARSALVVAWGKPSETSLRHVTNAQLDPFTLGPLGIDHVVSGALQASEWLATRADGGALMEVAVQHARTAAPAAARMAIFGDAPVVDPLWRRHMAPPVDGACAVVLAVDDVVRSLSRQPAWIVGADHRTDVGALGHRTLSALPYARRAMQRARALAGWTDGLQPDLAELSATFAHQVPLLRAELGLGAAVAVDPSGGALAADPVMATGLVRLAEAARRVAGGARHAVAHAASGHALQSNLVFCLEGDG